MASLRECLKQMIDAFGHGTEALAASMGLSASGFHNRRYEIKGQAFDVAELLVIQQKSGTAAFAEYVARESGGVFVALPDVADVDNDELLEKQQLLIEEVGTLAHKLRDAIRTDGIDRAEQAELEEETRKLFRLSRELVSVAVMVHGGGDVAR